MNEKILIVDDEPDLLELVRDTLEMAGYTVITASDGEEGLKSITEDSPDLVILDIKMPKIDGMEVLERVRKNPLLNELPVIMLTSLKGEGIIREAKEVGANDYIVKPFNQIDLLNRVKRVISSS